MSIVEQVARQSDAEKAIRKDLIESIVDGWTKFIRERVHDDLRINNLIKNAWNEAVAFGATMPFNDLVAVHVSRADTANMSYRMATEKEDVGNMLLGKEHRPN
jgi:hypothetical protein